MVPGKSIVSVSRVNRIRFSHFNVPTPFIRPALCAAEGIAFFSATPFLEAQAALGESGYLTSDTHWTPAGQRAILDPLLEFSESLLR